MKGRNRSCKRRATWIASLLALILPVLFISCASSRDTTAQRVVVYQPSHQSDTGTNYNEALVCNSIAEAAIAASTGVARVFKVWSYNQENLHHARQGSNTKIEHSAAIDSLGRISGYAYEIGESNKLKPDAFISIHNNGATKRNACWGFVHEGDEYEQQNRELAKEFVAEICKVSGMDNAGVLGDSSPNRNDYRCKNTGKLSFFSLDENTNTCPIRVLLEVGDNKESYQILTNPTIQKKIGEAIQMVIERWFGKRRG